MALAFFSPVSALIEYQGYKCEAGSGFVAAAELECGADDSFWPLLHVNQNIAPLFRGNPPPAPERPDR